MGLTTHNRVNEMAETLQDEENLTVQNIGERSRQKSERKIKNKNLLDEKIDLEEEKYFF